MNLPVRVLGHSARPTDLDIAVDWRHADIRDTSALESALDGVSVVYHLFSATVPGTAEKDPFLDLSGNVSVTLELLQRCVRSGIKKIVFVSSGGTVYGIPKILPISEDAPTKPIGIYGAGKVAIENYLNCYRHAYGLDFIVLRLSNPYGAGQRIDRNQGAISTFMRQALNNDPIAVWGDGQVVRDYIYIDDVIDALYMAGQTKTSDNIFNIGSGVGVSLNAIISELQNFFMRKLDVQYMEARNFDVPINILDISRARQQLFWEPKVPLAQGMQKMLEWIKSSRSV